MSPGERSRWCLGLILTLVLVDSSWASPAQLLGKVVDETGVAIPGAQITLKGTNFPEALYATSDAGGRFQLPPIPPGTYELKVEKRAYYAYVSHSFTIGATPAPIEVVLNHQQEYGETVNVVYSAPTIDRTEAAAQTTLTAQEIIDLPLPASHDFRNALPLVPGVVKDNTGRIHVNGGRESQVLYTLDGFNLTSPASGILENRISVDAIRAVRLETSRYSAEFGKGSAGIMALESLQGDDHFRFSATNFLPSYEFHNGLVLSNWTPRATVSGPIVKGRVWFFNAMDLQYDLNTIDALPSTANTNRNWFGSDLTRLQLKLTNRNILTLGFLFSFQNSRHYGLSRLDPVETSRNRHERFYFFNLRDQAYLTGGWILETGVALNRINTRDVPLGNATYTISPEGRSGNYFQQSEKHIERTQWLVNVLAPTRSWHGRHSLKFGVDADQISYEQVSNRGAFEVRRLGGTLARSVTFTGPPSYGKNNFEFSAFAQDRWSPTDRVLVEAGARLDWDQILREPLWSPRLAATWSPTRAPETKLSVGVGVFYDATNLGMLTRQLDQHRLDTFYDQEGIRAVRGPIQSYYHADERRLKAPFYLNWGLGWEQKLPQRFYLRTNFISKQGRRGWSYDLLSPVTDEDTQSNVFHLASQHSDRYHYLELTLTRTFREKYPWLFSYARSSARSSAIIDFSVDNPLIAQQASGPMDWDVPNRLISWAYLPAPFLKKYTVAYFLEWHSGFPYTVVNEYQHLVGAPNSQRFPDYFSLNLYMERRFRMWRYQWALRAGFQNITKHYNPVDVNNNVDSPHFGTFGRGQGRVFTGRIRFLGRS